MRENPNGLPLEEDGTEPVNEEEHADGLLLSRGKETLMADVPPPLLYKADWDNDLFPESEEVEGKEGMWLRTYREEREVWTHERNHDKVIGTELDQQVLELKEQKKSELLL